MTQEEKAKAYDEAIERLKPLYEQAKKDGNPIWSTYEYLVPELVESEDERIIEEIKFAVMQMPSSREDTKQKCLAWLEKHKECLADDSKTSESEDERIRKELISLVKEGGCITSKKDRKLALAYLEKQKELPFVKDVILGYPGLYFYDGERMHFQGNPAMEENPYDFAISQQEKQKEQKPEHFDLKAGKWYICHRAFCCRADHLTVKEGERFMCEKDGIVKGFVIKEPEKYFKECSAPAPMEDEQKEQKPNIELIQRSWYREGYNDRKFGKEPKWIIKTGEGGPKYEENPKYGQMLEAEQKPAEWSDEDEKIINDACCWIAEYAGYLMDKNYSKASMLMSLTDKLKSLRPQTKEELAKMLQDEYNKGKETGEREGYTKGYNKGYKDANESSSYHFPIMPTAPSGWGCDGTHCTNPQMDCINCPKKLTGGMFNTASSSGDITLKAEWKPSEEQMEALNALNCHGGLSYVGQQNQLISLYDDLKKLM